MPDSLYVIGVQDNGHFVMWHEVKLSFKALPLHIKKNDKRKVNK